ncbi:hypothetical protein [Pseudodesulfovibrio nedwellii]|nr:hypothetical protein [Pseudodesulfovibrio nedwellii]
MDQLTCRNKQNEIDAYSNWIECRLFPSIDSWDSEQKRTEHEINERNERKNFSEWHDPLDEFEEIITQTLQVAEVNSYMIGVSISGLYHLWEKQIIDHLIHELKHDWVIPEKHLMKTWNEINYIFKSYSTNLSQMSFYKNLEELRLVSNTIKHGNGSSYRQLVGIKADIVKPYNKSNNQPIIGGNHSLIRVDLFPRIDHYMKYKQAVLDFWNFDIWHSQGERLPFDNWPEKKKR